MAAAPISPSIFCSILLSLMNKTMIFELFKLWQELSSDIKGKHATSFSSRTITLDLEEQILILATSRLPMSFARSRGRILWSPDQTHSSHWLCLETLPIKVMNRTGDGEQPCHSPTCLGNRSDLMLVMGTKLLLILYRDRMAPRKRPRMMLKRSVNNDRHDTHRPTVRYSGESHPPSKPCSLLTTQ